MSISFLLQQQMVPPVGQSIYFNKTNQGCIFQNIISSK